MSALKRTRVGGRAKGTPNKITADLRLAAQAYTEEALQALADLMRSATSDQVRLHAALALLDRAHGKPTFAEPAADADGIGGAVFILPDNHRGDAPLASSEDVARLRAAGRLPEDYDRGRPALVGAGQDGTGPS